MESDFKWNGAEYSAANGLQTAIGERFIDAIELLPNMSVLDAGCGSGNLTFRLARKVPGGHVVAIDASASMIQKAQESLKEQELKNLELHVCGINEMKYRNQFDLVFSNSVLHWVREIDDGIRRLFDALKRGGAFEVQFPLLNADHPLVQYARRAIRELSLMKCYSRWCFPWYVPDSEGQFAEILKKAGFSNAEAVKESGIFSFPSADAVYQHFNSVGLNLFVVPLDETKKNAFFNQVFCDLTEDFPDRAELRYERIFARAQKP